jgi:hypothetical protein
MARNQITHICIVPGCPGEGRNQIGVRCRVAHSGETPFPKKGRTDSMFSVESDAFLCDAHALGGVNLTMALAPTISQEATVSVVCGTEMTSLRATPIKQPARTDQALREVA